MNFFSKKDPNLKKKKKKKKGGVGGGEGGARVSELFLQRIQIYKKIFFFLRGGGGRLEEGTRVSDFFYKESDFRHSLTSDLIVPLTLGIGTYLLCAT